uniref:Uncharacterized protein n=1 Tax=Anguilla anguilla TaxID=7936 RepID=A0A0E9TNY7_ANGAN
MERMFIKYNWQVKLLKENDFLFYIGVCRLNS